MIEFEHVSAAYSGEVPVLRDVSFTINDGDFVAFVGTNGAGKSTTMRLCNGLLKPVSGRVLIDGIPTTQLRVSELARRVGFLFQNPDRQICCPTVREELMFTFAAQGALTDAARERVERIVELFGFDPEAEPFLLNRGTRQLLALASIIVAAPPVVILDEPTTGLDYRECETVMGVVRKLHEAGTTVIMVCHDMEVVADYAQRVIVMAGGGVVADGATFEILRNREVMQRASLIPPQIVDISLRLAEDANGIGANGGPEAACAIGANAGFEAARGTGANGDPEAACAATDARFEAVCAATDARFEAVCAANTLEQMVSAVEAARGIGAGAARAVGAGTARGVGVGAARGVRTSACGAGLGEAEETCGATASPAQKEGEC